MKVIQQKNTEKLNRHIFIRDNLEVLRTLDNKSVDLIYLDPPFNKHKNFGAPIGSEVAGQHFKDIWTYSDTDDIWWGELSDKHPALYEIIHAVGVINGESHKSYLIAMAMRLLELHRVLKDTGSIYLHCDQTMSHSLKLVMDAIFKKRYFNNEITWRRIQGAVKTSQFKIRNFGKNSDTIFFYSKTNTYTFNGEEIKTPYPKKYIEKKFKWKDKKGLYQRRSPFCSKSLGARPNLCYKYKGFKNPYPSGWKTSKERLIEIDKDGDLEIVGNKIYRKLRLEKVKGIAVNNIWTDISQSMGKEKTGYSTQKPLALLERIIKASSNEGDLVLDPFCGCATTCVASEKLNRRWIGIDLSPLAGKLVNRRLLRQFEQGELGKKMVNPIITNNLPIKDAPKPSKDIKYILYGKQKGICNLCNTHFEFRMFQIDHIKPKSKGGQDTDKNLQLLCGPCNYQKGTKSMTEAMANFAKQSPQLSDRTKKISHKRTEELNQKQIITIIKKLLDMQKTNQPYKKQ